MPLFNYPTPDSKYVFNKEYIINKIKKDIVEKYQTVKIIDIDNIYDLLVIINAVTNIHTSKGTVHVYEKVLQTNIQLVICVKVLPGNEEFPKTQDDRDFMNDVGKWAKGMILAERAEPVLYKIEEYLNEIGISTGP